VYTTLHQAARRRGSSLRPGICTMLSFRNNCDSYLLFASLAESPQVPTLRFDDSGDSRWETNSWGATMTTKDTAGCRHLTTKTCVTICLEHVAVNTTRIRNVDENRKWLIARVGKNQANVSQHDIHHEQPVRSRCAATVVAVNPWRRNSPSLRWSLFLPLWYT